MKKIHLYNFVCKICNNFGDMCIAVKMFIFLCVAQILYFKEQDPQKQPSKQYQVENMATTCYPGQLCVVFDVCF